MWRYRLRMLWQRIGPPKAVVDRNAWLLSMEVAFASLLAAAGSFNAAYVVRLGASNTIIGLMSSIPSLEAMLLFIPLAAFLERRKSYMPWMVGSLLATRLIYPLIAVLPLLLTRGLGNVTALILILSTVPSVLFSVTWNPMFTDVVAPRSRAAVMSTRSILSAAIVAPLIFIAGRWLDSQQGTFPRNYQWLFLVGFVGGVISVYLVARIRAPQKALPAKGESRKSNWRDMLGFSILRDDPQFRRLTVNSFLISLGSWFVGPLYIILYVRELGASDSWIGASATLGNLGVILGYWIGRKLIKKLGENKGLLVTLPTTFTWPFLVALVANLTVILIGGFIQNVITPGWSLSHTMIWMSRLPEKNKMTATAVYSTAMNVGAFVMPMLGVALAGIIGIRNTLLIGGALNILGGLMFYIRPVSSRQEEPEPAPQGA